MSPVSNFCSFITRLNFHGFTYARCRCGFNHGGIHAHLPEKIVVSPFRASTDKAKILPTVCIRAASNFKSLMESRFIVKDISRQDERTFYKDEDLPPLPLPRVDGTIKKYLESCKAVLTRQEYENTKSIAENFIKNDGDKLQSILIDRAAAQRNWLEQWWVEKAYLEYRAPLTVQNFAGLMDIPELWPLKSGTQLERMSVYVHVIMKFWSLLREEKLIQQKTGSGIPFTMNQFRNLYNTSRIPKIPRDEIHNGFKVSSEGSTSTHVIVFYQERIYKIETMDKKTGLLYSPGQFLLILKNIKNRKHSSTAGGVAALTALHRDEWTRAREKLMGLSESNRRHVLEIQDAVLCIALGDIEVQNIVELLRYGLCGPCGDRWSDKSLNYHCTLNGGMTGSCDHTLIDGMVNATFLEYFESIIRDAAGVWSFDAGGNDITHATELEFKLDESLLSLIKKAKSESETFRKSLEIGLLIHSKFGAKQLKEIKVHPGAFVQICLQLAYMRRHGKPGSTYETATTRLYYHGRTETIRTCTTETVEFCKAMINDSPNKRTLFMEAHKRYLQLSKECVLGQGCDRHLLGLALAATENGYELPELFKDPAFVKSGGNGNFILSTSFTGFSAIGVTVPMRKDGYGMFYATFPNNLSVTLSAWKDCPSTDCVSISNYIEEAFDDVFSVLANTPSNL